MCRCIWGIERMSLELGLLYLGVKSLFENGEKPTFQFLTTKKIKFKASKIFTCF